MALTLASVDVSRTVLAPAVAANWPVTVDEPASSMALLAAEVDVRVILPVVVVALMPPPTPLAPAPALRHTGAHRRTQGHTGAHSDTQDHTGAHSGT